MTNKNDGLKILMYHKKDKALVKVRVELENSFDI